MSLTLEQADLLRNVNRLSQKDQATLATMVKQKLSTERKIWYCKRGRKCDGRPHLGADYPHARGDQWPPRGTDRDTWFYRSGRGVGKTAAGGHWVRQMAETLGPGGRIALVGRRGKDVRQTMVEGPSGLIKACERLGETYDWKPALMEFTFENGCVAYGYSAEEPESLRGPEHAAVWMDEPCHMALIEEVWSNLGLGLRAQGLPGGAKVLLTSSPLPTKWTKDRIAEKGQPILNEFGEQEIDEEGKPMFDPKTVLVSVPTTVNLHNLDEGYKRRVINPLRGTRKGKQELQAMLLEDVEGALWEQVWMDRKKYKRSDFDRIVVSVDPAGTNKKTSDMTGIVVCGRIGSGDNARYVVLADYTGHYTPDGWAAKVVWAYDRWTADAVVVERYGGDSATTILRHARHKGGTFKGNIVEVNAQRGKALRAEPISALYEQEMVDHLLGADLADLEDEMLTWVPAITKESPNRVDATVHAITELSGKARKPATLGRARGSLRPPKSRAPGSNYRRKNWAK